MNFVFSASDLMSSKLPYKITKYETIPRLKILMKIFDSSLLQDTIREEIKDKIRKNLLMTRSIYISNRGNSVISTLNNNIAKAIKNIYSLFKPYIENDSDYGLHSIYRNSESLLITDLLNNYIRISTIRVKSIDGFINALKFILSNKDTYGATIEVVDNNRNNETYSTFNLFSHTIDKDLILDKLKSGEELNIIYYKIELDKISSKLFIKNFEIVNKFDIKALINAYATLTELLINNNKYNLPTMYDAIKDTNFDDIKVDSLKFISDNKLKLSIHMPNSIKNLYDVNAFIVEPQCDVVRTTMYPGYGIFGFSISNDKSYSLSSNSTRINTYTKIKVDDGKDVATKYLSTIATPNIMSDYMDASICLGSMKYTKFNIYVLRDRNYDSPFFRPLITGFDLAIIKGQILYHANEYLQKIKNIKG